jgi:DNA-binding NarL/FixJ family response regulator
VPGPFDGNEEELAAAAQEAVARTRVVVADDSLLMRQGIRRVLEGAGFDVMGEAGDGAELMRLVEAEPPDVVVTDIRMPPTQTDEGLQAAQAIRARWPAVSVLVLSQYVEPSVACDLLGERPDGAGYLLKDRVADLGDFAEAVRRVARGGTALDPAVVTLLIGRPRLEDPLAALDDRQRELLSLVAQGLDDEEIAEQVGLSPRAVGIVVGEAISTLSLSAAARGQRRVRELLALLQTP